MKRISFLLFFVYIIFISCSSSEDNVATKSIVGQWVFNDYKGGGGGNPYGMGGGSELCDIHSIIFDVDNSFSLYTGNYVLLGIYSIDSVNNQIELSIDGQQIGAITNPEINESNSLSGGFNFDDLCVEVQDGYQDADYTKGTTYVPDPIFEEYLINQGYDSYLDSYVITSRVSEIGWIGDMGSTDDDICQTGNCTDEQWADLDYRFKNRIKNLSGIEAFSNVAGINIVGHKIDSINLTKNINLTHFYANFNEFKSVNTDHNPLLLIFSIDGNKPDWSEDIENGLIEPWDTITRLDFSKNYNIESISVPSLGLSNLNLEINKKITFLDLYKNNFSIFDLSQVPRLEELRIQQNNLIELDVSGNPQLITLSTGGNQNLSCIQVSEDQLAKINSGEMQDWNIDSHTTFSLICN
ncbi:MAG: hypothetical protein CMB81_02120 [Flammeovirgaceae bacterium]|nr:hypothetical protein [Flammeovirgaceae bacterium]